MEDRKKASSVSVHLLVVEVASFWLWRDCVNSPKCWKAVPASRKISPTEAEVTPTEEELEEFVDAAEAPPPADFVDDVIMTLPGVSALTTVTKSLFAVCTF